MAGEKIKWQRYNKTGEVHLEPLRDRRLMKDPSRAFLPQSNSGNTTPQASTPSAWTPPYLFRPVLQLVDIEANSVADEPFGRLQETNLIHGLTHFDRSPGLSAICGFVAGG